MEGFKKDDTGKVMASLVSPEYILGTAKVLTFGAKKYGVDNWKEATDADIQRYRDALLRHLYAYLSGELMDPESGIEHLYHVSCNVMFLDYFDGEPKEPKKYPVAPSLNSRYNDIWQGDILDILKD